MVGNALYVLLRESLVDDQLEFHCFVFPVYHAIGLYASKVVSKKFCQIVDGDHGAVGGGDAFALPAHDALDSASFNLHEILSVVADEWVGKVP